MTIQGDQTAPRIYFMEPEQRRNSFTEEIVKEQISSSDPARIVIKNWGLDPKIIHDFGFVRQLRPGPRKGFIQRIGNSMRKSTYFYLDRDY